MYASRYESTTSRRSSSDIALHASHTRDLSASETSAASGFTRIGRAPDSNAPTNSAIGRPRPTPSPASFGASGSNHEPYRRRKIHCVHL